MLNYEEELKKFTPCLDVDDVETSVYQQDLTDVFDLIKELEQERSREGRHKRPVSEKEPET